MINSSSLMCALEKDPKRHGRLFGTDRRLYKEIRCMITLVLFVLQVLVTRA